MQIDLFGQAGVRTRRPRVSPSRQRPSPEILSLDDYVPNSRAALEAKKEGISRVASHNATWVAKAREVAEELARLHGTVTADDVRAVLYPLGVIPAHPNAWGAVFRVGFEWTGEFHQSAVAEGHGNLQRVWRLRE